MKYLDQDMAIIIIVGLVAIIGMFVPEGKEITNMSIGGLVGYLGKTALDKVNGK